MPVGFYGEWVPTLDPPLIMWWFLLSAAFPEPDPLERQWWPRVEVGPG